MLFDINRPVDSYVITRSISFYIHSDDARRRMARRIRDADRRSTDIGTGDFGVSNRRTGRSARAGSDDDDDEVQVMDADVRATEDDYNYDDDGDYPEHLGDELPEVCYERPDLKNPNFNFIVCYEVFVEEIKDYLGDEDNWKMELLDLINKKFGCKATDIIFL